MDRLIKLDLNKKLGVLFIVVYLVVFAILPDEHSLSWSFIIILAIFYFCLNWTALLPVLVCIGIIVPFFKAKDYIVYVLQYDIFVILSVFFAYRMYNSFSEQDEKYLPEIKRMQGELGSVTEESNLLKNERDELKLNLEKTTELFRLCKEIVEHLDIKDMIYDFSRVVISGEKIKSVFFFQLDEKNNIDNQTVFFSSPDERPVWLEILKTHQELFYSRDVIKFVSLSHFLFDVIVFWPVYLESPLGYFMFRIDMVNEKESVEHLAPFFVQMSLALRRSKLYTEVEKMSRRDGLTGLFLRRYFLERFDEELLRAKRYSNKFAIFMIDIDYFKRVNDTYGHTTGDFVLEKLADIFMEKVHRSDLIARYGGEEFIIYVPHTSRKEALSLAEQIRLAVESKDFTIEGKCIKITISIGVSYYPENGSTKEEIITASDKALYWAKQSGRNRVKELRS